MRALVQVERKEAGMHNVIDHLPPPRLSQLDFPPVTNHEQSRMKREILITRILINFEDIRFARRNSCVGSDLNSRSPVPKPCNNDFSH